MHPDLIIVNGRAITFQPAIPRVGAVAISGGNIMAVGMTEEIRSLAGPDTRIFDAQGCTVLPGFIAVLLYFICNKRRIATSDI